MTRWVNARGQISLAGVPYALGVTFSGESVEVVVSGGLVQILHRGVLVASHAQWMRPDQAAAAGAAGPDPAPGPGRPSG